MRRRIRSTAVVLGALGLMMAAAVPAAGVAGFGDVAPDEFYTEAVQWMVDTDVTSGTSPGCFSPGNATTRGEIATFLHRAEGRPAGGHTPFADVAGTDYFAEAVGWMVRAGITTGTAPTTFSPDRLVTRGELAAFLHRAEGEPDGGAEHFHDVAPQDYFAEAVAWMVDAGITTGTSPTSFSPHRHVTRGEVATFLYRVAGEPAVALRGGGACATAGTSVALAVAEAESFNLLNDLRADRGLPPLVRLASMDASARSWSETMDRTGDFRHSSLPYGENIAWMSRGSASPEDAARRMHTMWVNSPGHLANMLRGSYTAVGVGFWQSDGGGWHATHVFS